MSIRESLGNQNETPLVIGVGGGGCHLETGSIAFRMIKSTLEDNKIDYAQVHGCDDLYGAARVVPPSEQQLEIEQIISNTQETRPILLLGHCMGGCAIVSYLRDSSDSRPVSGAIFAPATQPDKVVLSPQSKARRHENDTVMRLNVLAGTTRDYGRDIKHSVDAALPPAYLDEAFEAHSTMADMLQLVRLGRLSLWAAENDWNKTSPADIVKLRQQCGDQYAERLRVVSKRGYSLHPPATRDGDYTAQVAGQKATIETLLDTEITSAMRASLPPAL